MDRSSSQPTCTVMGDLQGPLNLVWFSKNVFPFLRGCTYMITSLLWLLQATFHVSSNAFQRTNKQKINYLNLMGNIHDNDFRIIDKGYGVPIVTSTSLVAPSPAAWKSMTLYHCPCCTPAVDLTAAIDTRSSSSTKETCCAAVLCRFQSRVYIHS